MKQALKSSFNTYTSVIVLIFLPELIKILISTVFFENQVNNRYTSICSKTTLSFLLVLIIDKKIVKIKTSVIDST